jgi:hypothetical protein
MMISHVKVVEGFFQFRDDLGIAMAQVIGSAVEVEIDQPVATHVIEMIALTTANHEVHSASGPGVYFVRIPVLGGILEDGGFVRVDEG